MNDGKTNNIYKSWLETVDCNRFPSNRIKKLSSFTVEEIHHLIWLLQEELRSRDAYNRTI